MAGEDLQDTQQAAHGALSCKRKICSCAGALHAEFARHKPGHTGLYLILVWTAQQPEPE